MIDCAPSVDVARKEFELAMQRCGRGEAAAFGIVYDQLINIVWRVIGMSKSETQDAEALTLAVFIELWRQVPHYNQITCNPQRWALDVALDIVAQPA